MRNTEAINQKILNLKQAQQFMQTARMLGKTVAFTNGCFDILHEGHIFSLSQAANEADYLMVAVNADASVKKLKGESRPINNQQTRALLLASLLVTDAIIIFEEDTPQQIIASLLPDVLVKGGDYTVDQIAGAKEVIANGGRIIINPLLPGFSTTGIIQKIHSLG